WLAPSVSNAASVVDDPRVVKLRFDGAIALSRLPSRLTVNCASISRKFDLCDVIGLHGSDIFAVPRGLANYADQRDADTGVREHRAPGRTRQSARAPH